eukprot:1159892-Pelagomonas_calceolata.AAC.18
MSREGTCSRGGPFTPCSLDVPWLTHKAPCLRSGRPDRCSARIRARFRAYPTAGCSGHAGAHSSTSRTVSVVQLGWGLGTCRVAQLSKSHSESDGVMRPGREDLLYVKRVRRDGNIFWRRLDL